MSRVRAAERRYVLKRLNEEAQADLNRLWLLAADSSDFVDAMVEGYLGVADPYHQLAAQIAAGWFEDAAPFSRYIAETVEPLKIEQLEKSVRWALAVGDETTGESLLGGSLQRAVFDGARDTTALNVANTRGRWAIESDSQCCDYCAMLVSRGAVYISQDTAESSFHDNCSCVAVEYRD